VVPADVTLRRQKVRALGEAFAAPELATARVSAYVADTAFRIDDVEAREVRTPSALCALAASAPPPQGTPLGKIAVLVPRNSVGLTLAKAVVGGFLAGNEVLVRLPTQLERTRPLVDALLREHLPGVTTAPDDLSSRAFLTGAMHDPSIAAVVVYGDDAWIDDYRGLAERTRTELYFEGPGSDPLIVLEGCDVDVAVDAALRGGLHNGGQSCSAFERFFVHQSLHDAFVTRLVARLEGLRVGAPTDRAAGVGPIASSRVRARILDQIAAARAEGATLRFGGQVVQDVHEGLPALVPAVLTGCTPAMAVMAEETFGPVFPVMAFAEDDGLLSAVDACRYGLNAAAFGPGAERLRGWLTARHRNVFIDATPFDAASLPERNVDGGYRRSGFAWRFRDGEATVTEGPRILARALQR
jgi:succinate-semialdehyde dehydrogenase/glutarate-semialdehyde dehydrogenase